MDTFLSRRRFRMIVPAYPAFNIFSRIASQTTSLGSLAITTLVSHMSGWDVEVIDENNYRKFGPRGMDGRPDHMSLTDRLKRFRQFIRKSHLDTLQVLLPVPLPGTALTERLAHAKKHPGGHPHTSVSAPVTDVNRKKAQDGMNCMTCNEIKEMQSITKGVENELFAAAQKVSVLDVR